MKKICVKIFPALNGDSIFIDVAETYILIDGGYVNTYNQFLKKELNALKDKGLSYLIVTHIDGDHISGINKLITDSIATRPYHIKNIWFNAYRHIQKLDSPDISYNGVTGKKLAELEIKNHLQEVREKDREISAEQGSTLASLINQADIPWNNEFEGKAVSIDNLDTIIVSPNIILKLLSPNNEKLKRLSTYWAKELYKMGYKLDKGDDALFDDAFEFILSKERESLKQKDKTISAIEPDLTFYTNSEFEEDRTVTNGSSIAFVLEHLDKKLLFLGDAHPSLIIESLKRHYPASEYPLKFDLIKVSHHGSMNNTGDELLKIIDSERFVFSTNGNIFNHPDLETIAKIVTRTAECKRKLFFNYPISKIESLCSPELMSQYNYEIVTGDGKTPLEIEL